MSIYVLGVPSRLWVGVFLSRLSIVDSHLTWPWNKERGEDRIEFVAEDKESVIVSGRPSRIALVCLSVVLGKRRSGILKKVLKPCAVVVPFSHSLNFQGLAQKRQARRVLQPCNGLG